MCGRGGAQLWPWWLRRAAIDLALAGQLLLAEYVKLVGLFNHLVCVMLMPYHSMYGVYDALDAARQTL